MAFTAARIGTGGMSPRKHEIEPDSRARALGQDRKPVNLLSPARLR